MEEIGIERLREAAAQLSVPSLDTIPDRLLLELQRDLAEVRRIVDATSASLAAETARRSDRALGYGGLAQRLGMRTPEALVQRVTGATAREARELVTVGGLLSDDSAVGTAVAEGRLSVAAASAITDVLATASDVVPPEVLEAARVALVGEAAARTVEQLARRAREVRDELDVDGVDDRAARMRDQRFLRLIPLDDGMTRLLGLLDPESAARVRSVVDSVTSPRRGGPRFVAADVADRARDIVADERTTEQLALDAIVDLLDAGAAIAPDSVRSVAVSPVQVLVTAADLAAGRGIARIEGESAAVGVATAQRSACVGGIAPIVVDLRGPRLDLGRQQRFFTRAQRRALAARDGGCRVPGCDRPPSWCEAHHIEEWVRGGRTDLAQGILLCRHHHLMVHDNGWRIEREGFDYFLVPPEREDPLRRRIPMPTKNPLLTRLAG